MSKKSFCILQVIPAFNTGGVEQGTVEISHALQQNGHRSLVASSGGRLLSRLDSAEEMHCQLPLNSKQPQKILINAWRLSRLIKKQNVDLVHARSRAPAWSAYLAARSAGVPFVTTFHAAYGLQNGFKSWYNSVMARGCRIIAISDFIAEHIEQHYGQYLEAGQKIHTIHRGVDCEAFSPHMVSQERVRALEKQWGLTSSDRLILLPARVTRIKGHMVLLQALKGLNLQGMKCVFVGQKQAGSRFYDELLQTIQQLQLQDTVKLVGHCQDMPAANLRAEVVVVPSIVPEGFGRTIAEAGAMGTPIIASDLGAAPEIVVHNQTGWLAPVGNPEAFAQAIEQVFSMDLEQREVLAQKARQRIETHFSQKVMCEKTLDVYQSVLGD